MFCYGAIEFTDNAQQQIRILKKRLRIISMKDQ